MAINREDLEHLEDSLVHDADDPEPQPEGWGIYVTPRFLARATLVAYGMMLVLVLLGDYIYESGQRIPLFLNPGSLFVALPFSIVALYLHLTTNAEPVLERQRTLFGRIVTVSLTYVILQALTTGIWIGIALAFKLK